MASLHVPIVEAVQGAGVVSRRTKLYAYDSLGRGRVYAENEIVYGKVYKRKLQQYAITKRIGNGQRMRARTLPVYTRPCFSPPQLIKTGPGDEASSTQESTSSLQD